MASARTLFLVGLLYCGAVQAQEPQAYFGAPDCRIARLRPPPAEPVNWSGECKDGYAQGHGTLEWHTANKSRFVLEATLERGQIEGEAKLKIGDARTYIGTFSNGLPNGKGYLKDDRQEYEGDIVNGRPEGKGVAERANGDRYEGQWKNGEPDGIGRMAYMLGGSYEGEWKRGKRDGQGVLVYAGSARRYEGQFSEGRLAGAAPAPRPGTIYSLKAAVPATGSNIPYDIARGAVVPPDLGYAKLTPEQKALVNSYFPALEEGDEPPYPLHGLRPFYELMSKAVGRTGVGGDVRIYVTVGADGKPLSATTIGLDDADMRKFAGMAAMSQQYKPAVCQGKPCQMVYPYRLRLKPEK
jgi:hypothetical protein